MKPDAKILESNIARLIKRAYVPALPHPAYRSQLKQSYLQELRRLRAKPQPERRSGWRLLPLLALAAGLLLAFFISQALDSNPKRSALQLVAENHVALAWDGGPWRAASESELRDGLDFELGKLALQTSDELGIRVNAPGGELALGTKTLASISQRLSGLTAKLNAGELVLSVQASTPQPWSIHTPSGTLYLSEGELSLLLTASGESLQASGEGALVARFQGSNWSHSWPADGDLLIHQGQSAPGDLAQLGGWPARNDLGTGAAPTEEAQPEGPSKGTLLGRVLHPEGQPLQNFRLALLAPTIGHDYAPPLLRSFAQENGSFRWEGVPSGSYTLFVHADGLAMAQRASIHIESNSLIDPLEIQMELGGSLRGFVFDARTQDPIAGALVLSQRDMPQSVFIQGAGQSKLWVPASTRSAADGSFELKHLSSGLHALHISAQGFGPHWQSSSQIVNGETQAGSEFALRPGFEIQGQAIDARGEFMRGAMIVVSHMETDVTGKPFFSQAFTDQEGRYRISDLPVDSLMVVLIDADRSQSPRIKPALGKRGKSMRVDFFGMSQGTELKGRFLGAQDQAMAYFDMAIFEQDQFLGASRDSGFEATTTDADGNYAFKQLEPGNYLIFRVHEDRRTIRLVKQVRVSGLPEQIEELRLGEQSISGRVLDGRSGLPLQTGHVALWFRQNTTGERCFGGMELLDAQGSYVFKDLNPGDYWISAYSEGELGFQLSDVISLGARKSAFNRDLQLSLGASVQISIQDAEGRPADGCSLIFSDKHGPTNAFESEAQTDVNGQFLGRGLHPGSLELHIIHPGHKLKTVQFNCSAGQTSQLQIRLEADS